MTQAPVRDVLVAIAHQTGLSVVPPDAEDLLDVAFVEAEPREALEAIGRRLNLSPVHTNGVVVFDSNSTGYDVFELVPGQYDEVGQLADTFGRIVGSEGAAIVLGDRILVAGSDAGLDRARKLNTLVGQGPDGWMLDVFLVQVSRELREDLGLGLSVGADAVGGVLLGLEGVRSVPLVQARAAATAAIVAEAVRDGRFARLATRGTIFLLEGREGVLQQGDVVPIPRRVTTPEGTVVTEGYDFIDTGFNLTARGRRVPQGLLLELRPSLSTVTGFVEEAPITTEQSVDSTLVVSSGEWVVLSGFETLRDSSSTRGVPGFQWSALADNDRETSESSLLMLVRATRVQRATSTPEESSVPANAGT